MLLPEPSASPRNPTAPAKKALSRRAMREEEDRLAFLARVDAPRRRPGGHHNPGSTVAAVAVRALEKAARHDRRERQLNRAFYNAAASKLEQVLADVRSVRQEHGHQ
jgi:hypothetical protein